MLGRGYASCLSKETLPDPAKEPDLEREPDDALGGGEPIELRSELDEIPEIGTATATDIL